MKTPDPNMQVGFYYRLQEIRGTHLLQALLGTVAELEVREIDRQLAALVCGTALQRVAACGLRGEVVFPVPCVLRRNPCLLGYYRLLLGFSQKQFYGDRYGFSRFKSMEEHGRLSTANEERIEDLCKAVCGSAKILVEGIGGLSQQTVHELTLLTLGPQLRGGVLNALGGKATQKVFDLIHSLLCPHAVSEDVHLLKIRNAAGRSVRVEFAADPDICIREELPSGRFRSLVAIEIKGGLDYSNIHNRLGEAEKSHQKARTDGYVECWTIVGVAQLDIALARRESPTTDRFYHIDRIMEPASEESQDFRENLLARVGMRA